MYDMGTANRNALNRSQSVEQPKELLWVKGAGHVDLYDRTDLIPFAELAAFFRKRLDGSM